MLSHEQAKAFYDRFGARQDSQRFYEASALRDLLAHGAFEDARSVFEFGCGTGRLAEQLLSDRLPSDCSYQAIDISSTMVQLACERLAPWRSRANVTQTSGAMHVPAPDGGADRFVACYVLDLLSDRDIRDLLADARRVLVPGGLLCVVGLTHGTSPLARFVGWLWRVLFRLHPQLVGGCRAIEMRDYLDASDWTVCYANIVTRFGISSQVVVACPQRGEIK